MMNATFDVKALRLSRNWTQDQMAEYLGLDRSSVSRIENGAEISGPVRRLLEMLETSERPAPAEQPTESAQ